MGFWYFYKDSSIAQKGEREQITKRQFIKQQLLRKAETVGLNNKEAIILWDYLLTDVEKDSIRSNIAGCY